jgi:hypothetical protein
MDEVVSHFIGPERRWRGDGRLTLENYFDGFRIEAGE